MNVYMINTVSREDNAPGRIMLGIANALTANGGNAYIASRDYGCLKSYRILSHAFLSRINDSEGRHSLRATRVLCRDIEAKNTDLIHLHNIHGHYVNYPYLCDFIKEHDYPVVWTMHDCWPWTGHCAYYTYQGCDKWRYGCHDCVARRDYPVSYWVDRSRYNWASKRQAFSSLSRLATVAVSKWMEFQIKASFLSCHPSILIYNGVDTDVFKPTPRQNQDKGKFTIIAVASNWKRHKGLEALKRIRTLLRNDEQLVLISGVKNPHDLALLYANADLLLNPSNEEAFGMTTIEAMSCGLPVIVNHNTALPEPVAASTGYVIDFSDMGLMRQAIDAIREKGRGYFVQPCRQHVLANYSLGRMTTDYLNLYREITRKPGVQ